MPDSSIKSLRGIMMSGAKEKIFTIEDEVEVGPVLALIALVVFTILGSIQWQLLLVVFLYSLGSSIKINWRKLLKK